MPKIFLDNRLKSKIYSLVFTFALFTSPSYALEMPDDKVYLENATTVAELGWKEANPSLKVFFDEFGVEFIDTYTKSSSSACNMPDLGEMSDSDLNITTYLNNNIYALSYARYLESLEETDSALLIYKYILKQSTLCINEELNMLDLIYIILTEQSVIESLTSSLENKVYNPSQRQELHAFLKDNLLLSSNTFTKVLENERLGFLSYCPNSGEFNEYTAAKFNEACIQATEKIGHFYLRIDQVSTKIEAEELTDLLKIEKGIMVQKFQEKYPGLIDINVNDAENNINMIDVETLSELLYYVSMADFVTVKVRLLEHIEDNKNFINNIRNRSLNHSVSHTK